MATTITNKNQYEEAGLKLGFGKAVYDAQYNATGEPTWTPIAQAIKDAGVKGLFYVGEPSDFSQLLSALASIDYKLDWVAAVANEYDPKLLAGAGKALDFEPVYVALGTTPFETDSTAIKQYEAPVREVPAQQHPQAGVPGPELVLGLVAVRPVGASPAGATSPPSACSTRPTR